MAKGDPSSDYVPHRLHAESVEELARNIESELHRVAAAFALGVMRSTEFLHAEPDKPREGMVAGADGTDWDPGSGQGIYVYFAGAWQVLFTASSLVDHNSTTGKQGGTTNEFYHLTQAQHTDLTDGNEASIHHHNSLYDPLGEAAAEVAAHEAASNPHPIYLTETEADALYSSIAHTHALDDLSDVDVTSTPPTDGQALVWDDANSEWVPGDVAASGGGGGGSLVLLEQKTASASATLDFTGCISSDYDEYLVEFINIVPASTPVDFYMRMSTDGGATYDSTNKYAAARWSWIHSATGVNGNALTAPVGQIGLFGGNNVANDANYGVCGQLRLFSPQSTSVYKRVLGYLNAKDGGGTFTNFVQSGVYQSTTAVNAFRFLFSSGNIASGTIRCYGVRKTTSQGSGEGSVVQVAEASTATYSSNTPGVAFPIDDTVPQNNEGSEILTLSVTPSSATNKLKIEAHIQASIGSANHIQIALFQDSTASAIAADKAYCAAAGGMVPVELVHWMTAGSTSPITFKIRMGAQGGGALYINGNSAGRFYGGVAVSRLIVTEINPAGTSGEPLPTWVSEHPLTPPSSVNAKSDYFDDSSGSSGTANGLHADWTQFGATLPGITFINGRLRMTGPASGGVTSNAAGIYRTAPATPFSVVTKVWHNKFTNYNIIGLNLRESATGKYFSVSTFINTASFINTWVQTERYTNATTRAANLSSFQIAVPWLWMKLTFDGTTISPYVSWHGSVWHPLATEAKTTLFGAGTPDQIGLSVNGFSTNSPDALFEMFEVS